MIVMRPVPLQQVWVVVSGMMAKCLTKPTMTIEWWLDLFANKVATFAKDLSVATCRPVGREDDHTTHAAVTAWHRRRATQRSEIAP